MNDTGEMTQIRTPEPVEAEVFNDATKAVDRLQELYDAASTFLCAEFEKTLGGQDVSGRIRAYYPEVRLRTTSFAQTDNRLSFGHVTEPGTYVATVTRPDLFRSYLIQQLELVMDNHKVPVEIGPSATPMPVHFAVANDSGLSVP